MYEPASFIAVEVFTSLLFLYNRSLYFRGPILQKVICLGRNEFLSLSVSCFFRLTCCRPSHLQMALLCTDNMVINSTTKTGEARAEKRILMSVSRVQQSICLQGRSKTPSGHGSRAARRVVATLRTIFR